MGNNVMKDVYKARMKPTGHTAYTRRTKSGKLVLQAKTKEVKKGFTMSNDLDFEELFSEELTKSVDADDRVIIHCPHCAEGITKSQVISKASDEDKMAGQNNGGKNKRGGKDGAHNKATPTRPKGATAKTNEPNPGAYDTKKSAVDDSDDASADTEEGQKAADEGKKPVMKSASSSQQAPRVLGGSSYVNYIDTGEDARIAERILKGINGHNANDRTPHNGY